MYPVSNEFHTAVANNATQKALLLFSDDVFTNEDISMEEGIELNEYFNADEDLTPGGTPSSELNVTLFNPTVTVTRRVEHSKEVMFNQLNTNAGAEVTTGGITFTKSADIDTSGEWVMTGACTSASTKQMTANNGAPFVAGHVYYVTHGADVDGSDDTFACVVNSSGGNAIYFHDKKGAIFTASRSYNRFGIRVFVGYAAPVGGQIVRPWYCDLTLMFGEGVEPQTVEEFRTMLPEPFYPYDAGTLKTITWYEEERKEEPILRNYEFGECRATIGVDVEEVSYTKYSTAETKRGGTKVGNTYIAFSIRNNPTGNKIFRASGTNPIDVQPDFQPLSIIMNVVDTDPKFHLYAFDDIGNVFHVTNTTNAQNGWSIVTGETYTPHMKEFFKRIAVSDYGYGFNESERSLVAYRAEDLMRITYECCPLGVFNIERPKVDSVDAVSITANDRMMLFDEDIPDGTFTFPTTIGGLLTSMCDAVGVVCDTTTFINSTATVQSKPKQFDTATMRNVLSWIAQASCSIARFNRDGHLELRWLNPIQLNLNEGDYEEFAPYYYETPTVDKLVYRDTSHADKVVGSGETPFLIQDNPLLTNADVGSTVSLMRSAPKKVAKTKTVVIDTPRIPYDYEVGIVEEGDEDA